MLIRIAFTSIVCRAVNEVAVWPLPYLASRYYEPRSRALDPPSGSFE